MTCGSGNPLAPCHQAAAGTLQPAARIWPTACFWSTAKFNHLLIARGSLQIITAEATSCSRDQVVHGA